LIRYRSTEADTPIKKNAKKEYLLLKWERVKGNKSPAPILEQPDVEEQQTADTLNALQQLKNAGNSGVSMTLEYESGTQ
jgi:hypothetical protein